MKALTVVGGGSAYTPGLVQALIHHHETLELRTVTLYDIEHERAELVATLCDKMAQSSGAPFRVRAASTLASAVRGCDVVLNSSRPGGFECRHVDETLPLEFGIPGQETVGPGGFFFALRSVPEALLLARTLREHAPDAVLLNYTNPTNIVTQALHDEGYRVVGLCDQSEEDLHGLAQACGIEGTPTFACVGLNHATWYCDVQVGGKRFAAPGSLQTPDALHGEYRLRFMRSLELAERHPGYWPNSYLAYYDAPDRFVAIAKEQGVRSDAILARLPAYFEHFREEADKDEPVLRHHRGTEGFGDMAVRVLQSLVADEPTHIALNVPNRDTFDCFAADTVVETICSVSRAGHGAAVSAAPPADEVSLLKQLERYQRLTAEVAVRGERQGLAAALAENPLVESMSMAEQLVERAKERYDGRIGVLA